MEIVFAYHNPLNGNPVLVTYELIEGLDLEDKLLKTACDNDKFKLDIKVIHPYDTYRTIQSGSIMEMDNLIDFSNPEWTRWMCSFVMVTNTKMHFGASGILNADLLKKIAYGFNSNLFIIPSSIHECYLVSELHMDYCKIEDMLREVNQTLENINILSNEVYYYHKESESIRMASEKDIILIKMSDWIQQN